MTQFDTTSERQRQLECEAWDFGFDQASGGYTASHGVLRETFLRGTEEQNRINAITWAGLMHDLANDRMGYVNAGLCDHRRDTREELPRIAAE